MAVADVANGLVGLCSKGQFMEAIENYYSDDIVSVEPVGGPGMPAKQEGIEAIKGKNQWWMENHEVHGMSIKGPYVGDGAFSVFFEMDVTPKGQRQVEMSYSLPSRNVRFWPASSCLPKRATSFSSRPLPRRTCPPRRPGTIALRAI